MYRVRRKRQTVLYCSTVVISEHRNLLQSCLSRDRPVHVSASSTGPAVLRFYHILLETGAYKGELVLFVLHFLCCWRIKGCIQGRIQGSWYYMSSIFSAVGVYRGVYRGVNSGVGTIWPPFSLLLA